MITAYGREGYNAKTETFNAFLFVFSRKMFSRHFLFWQILSAFFLFNNNLKNKNKTKKEIDVES